MGRRLSGLDENFGKNLRKLRGELSQVQFSKRLGVSQSTLNRLENVESSATLFLVDRICSRLKIEPSDLLVKTRK